MSTSLPSFLSQTSSEQPNSQLPPIDFSVMPEIVDLLGCTDKTLAVQPLTGMLDPAILWEVQRQTDPWGTMTLRQPEPSRPMKRPHEPEEVFSINKMPRMYISLGLTDFSSQMDQFPLAERFLGS
jgi:hypothetical protein